MSLDEMEVNDLFLEQYAKFLSDKTPILQVIGGGKMAEVLVQRFVAAGILFRFVKLRSGILF